MLTMVVNLATGILIARTLGPGGRGQLSAIMNVPALVGWALTMGAGVAIQFRQATHPQDAARLVGTWLAICLPLGLIAFLVGQLVLHVTFAAQTAATVHLAQLYLVTIFLLMLNEINSGVLLGDHDFLFINLTRFFYPLTVATLYFGLWALHRFSVTTALIATVVVGVISFLITAVRVLKRHGIAKPDLHLGMTTLWYGVRGHGTTVAASLNERLDLLILPAFLGATQVGIYAVATNVSWIVFTIASAINSIVLSVAARQADKGFRTVVYSMHVTMLIALGGAVVLGVSADFALHLVYGSRFAASALPLRWLLPGTVLYVGAWILGAGLYAANRPFTAAVTNIVGALITVPGLLIFLRPGGVVAAAVVTTISYAVVFAASLVLYSRATGHSLKEFMPTADELSQLMRMARTIRNNATRPQPALAVPGDNSSVHVEEVLR